MSETLRRWPLFATVALMVFAAPPAGSRARQQATTTSQDASTSQPSEAGAAKPAETVAVPLPKGLTLFLKDGTFQVVREYHREGDHVRYFSVERSAWEEIPSDLIDFAATEKAEKERQTQIQTLDQKLKAADLAARTAGIDADTSFEVRPGMLLPDGAGLFAVSGDQVFTLQQTLAVSRLNKGMFVARLATGVPLISDRHTIEIAGQHAKLRIVPRGLEFYFRTADGKPPEMALLRTTVQGDKRKLENMSTNVVGINSYKGNEVPLQMWDAAQGLYRFTIEQALTPGEYALAESNAEGDVSLYIWDFGIDAPTGAGPK